MASRTDLTTIHVRRAIAGDVAGTDWVVARFTPLLLAQARYRMGQLKGLYEPDDVVADVWTAVLPKLSEVPLPGDRATPVFVRYLSTALLYEVNNLLRKQVAATVHGEDTRLPDPVVATPDRAPGPVSRVVDAETRGQVLAAIEALEESDREILILRGIEQVENARAAEQLGLEPNTAAQRYRRALQRLRERLPGSVFDDLDAA
ncbi:MAG: sigma-70 family RNA polymerase sigma factor [Planctomycetota bacterium]